MSTNRSRSTPTNSSRPTITDLAATPDRTSVTFTLDFEDNWYAPGSSRHRDTTLQILEMLDRLGIRGTIFVLARLTTSDAEIIREFAAHGHEIAMHGYDHVPFGELDLKEFRAQTSKGLSQLEDLIQVPVVGYRAPYFSMVKSTAWAADVLAEAGFRYSSSLLPARNPQYGWPEAPARPLRWPNGLLEFPVPVAEFGNLGLPFLGGLYLRLLPRAAVTLALRRSAGQLLWSYCHPYDIDGTEEFQRVERLGRVTNRLLWARRRAMLSKLEWLFGSGAAPPLRDRVGLAASMAVPVPI